LCQGDGLSRGEIEKSIHIALNKQFPGEKGSERRHAGVMQQPVILTPNFG
jgi:hypothetical protein